MQPPKRSSYCTDDKPFCQFWKPIGLSWLVLWLLMSRLRALDLTRNLSTGMEIFQSKGKLHIFANLMECSSNKWLWEIYSISSICAFKETCCFSLQYGCNHAYVQNGSVTCTGTICQRMQN
jgi:hypothetical protein